MVSAVKTIVIGRARTLPHIPHIASCNQDPNQNPNVWNPPVTSIEAIGTPRRPSAIIQFPKARLSRRDLTRREVDEARVPVAASAGGIWTVCDAAPTESMANTGGFR